MARITTAFPSGSVPVCRNSIGKIDKLPFDQHSLKACVAPRALLTNEALGDLWANPEGTQVTHTAAKEVFNFLGAGDKVAIHFREGKHEQNRSDFETLVDYADKVFLRKDRQDGIQQTGVPRSAQAVFLAGTRAIAVPQLVGCQSQLSRLSRRIIRMINWRVRWWAWVPVVARSAPCRGESFASGRP